MKILRFLIGLAVAAVLHSLGSRLVASFPAVVDLFLILAVYNSLSCSPAWSMAGGSAAGLVRDALSGGLYGLHGFADTLVAYLTARLQQRLVIQQPLQIGLHLAVAAAVQLGILAALQALLVPGAELPGVGIMAARMTSSGILGWALFIAAGRFRNSVDHWREQRRRRLTMVG